MHVMECRDGQKRKILQLQGQKVKQKMMCRYAAAYPDEDGYRRVETLNEDVLGSDLWTAARVSHFWRNHLLSTTQKAYCSVASPP